MKILTHIFLPILASILLSSDTIGQCDSLMSEMIFKLKDTTGIDFNNVDSLESYKWIVRRYSLDGRIIETTKYPISRLYGKETKVFYYNGDTVKTDLYLNDVLVSKTSTVHSGKHEIFKETRKYGRILGSFFEEYDYTSISTILKDTVTGRDTYINAKDFGSTIDTTSISTHNPDSLIRLRRDPTSAYKPIALDTAFGPLSIHGYLASVYYADTYLYYKNVLRIDSTTEYHKTIRFDNYFKDVVNGTAYVKNGLVIRTVTSTWRNGDWNVNQKESFDYYPCGNVRMKIRDEFRKGEFAFRYVSFFKYEYY